MKVLIVNSDPYDEKIIPYIRSIIESVKKCDASFDFGWGYDKFWNNEVFTYDIIHFMFCHLVLTDKKTVSDLKKRFEQIRKFGKRIFIVATCHNLETHYSSEKENVYDVVYKNCDQIYHLGHFSLDFGKEHYSNAENVMLEHPVYNNIFTSFTEKDESLDFLGLKGNKKYILCMGAFRNKAERNFLIKIARELKKENFYILAPSFYHYSKRRNLIKMFIKMFKYLCFAIYGKIYFSNILFTGKHCGSFVPEEEFKYFYGAADLCFIQRLKILNSGNLIMAFFFGKAVCGPNVGNVGELLTKFENITFDVENPLSAVDSIRKTYELSKTTLGDKNRQYVLENWPIEKIGIKQCAYYKELVK